MNIFRRSLAALSALLMIAPLAACGSDDSGTNSSGQVTLKVASWKGGGAEPANVAEINAAFAKANPNIKLDFQYVPPNDVYQQKLQSQLLAGNAPDVFMVDPQKVQSWGKSGYLADLSSQGWVSGVADKLKPYASLQDKVLAAPMELSPVGVFVNLDILAKAGVKQPPTDFPALMSALAALKSAKQPGLALPDAQGFMAEFVMLLSAATTVNQKAPDWDQQFMAGKVTFPQSYQAPLDQLKQIGDAGYVDYKSAVGTDESTTGEPDFIAGKSALFPGGAWLAAQISKATFKTAFIPWPGGDAGVAPSALLFPGTMWSVNARTKQADAAHKYLDFWAQSSNLAPYLKAEVAISPYQNAGAAADPLLETMAAAYAAGRYTLFPSNTWDLADPETKIRSILQGFLLGKTDVPATLEAIQKAATPSGS